MVRQGILTREGVPIGRFLLLIHVVVEGRALRRLQGNELVCTRNIRRHVCVPRGGANVPRRVVFLGVTPNYFRVKFLFGEVRPRCLLVNNEECARVDFGMAMTHLEANEFRTRNGSDIQVNHGVRHQVGRPLGLHSVRRGIITKNRRRVNLEVAYLCFPASMYCAEDHVTATELARSVVVDGVKRLLLCDVHVLL